MKRVLGLTVLALVFSAGTTLQAQVKLASIFSDNMVLQQNQKVKIWGTAQAGTPVTVKASWNETAAITADDNGNWQTYLNTPKAGTNTYRNRGQSPMAVP